jgi:hypothetical protein
MKKRSISLRLERLEDRTNPSSLTISFVPDGTVVGALHSELFRDYTGTATATWQQQLLSEIHSGLTDQSTTLSIVPDDGAALNTAAPQDVAIRVAAVNELFASDGSIVYPPSGQDFMVVGGNTSAFGIGFGLVGPNGQPVGPTPPSGGGGGGSMLPLKMPVQKASGNVYAPPPNQTPTSSPDGTPH